MKRILRLTESELSRIVRRIISEDDETRIRLINKFYDLFQDKTMNFYLPNDYTDPIIRQFMVDKIEISEDSNTLTLIGKGKKPNGKEYPGNIKLQYTCNSKNTFKVEIDRFKDYSWNNIYNLFDSGIPDTWKVFLRSFADFKFKNDYEMDEKEQKDYYKKLTRDYKRPFVNGGIDLVGKEMIRLITDEMCSINIKGNTVPKADFASLGTKINNNLG